MTALSPSANQVLLGSARILGRLADHASGAAGNTEDEYFAPGSDQAE